MNAIYIKYIQAFYSSVFINNNYTVPVFILVPRIGVGMCI